MNANEALNWALFAGELKNLYPPICVWCEVQLPGTGYKLLLNPDQISIYQNDPIAFCAQYFHTTSERFRAWLIYYEEHCQCNGITRTGQRCNSHGPLDVSPTDFIPGESDRCFQHVNLSE
jgi:hypothetical protein